MIYFMLLLVGMAAAGGVDKRSSPSNTSTTDCLLDALSCISKNIDPHQEINAKISSMEKELASIKSTLAAAGTPSNLATLDASGHLAKKHLPSGYGTTTPYDMMWQALHMAAAAACRGSTASGGTGCCANYVRVRNTASKQRCDQICQVDSLVCDGEVSINGFPGKATNNGQNVGYFYNYNCGSGGWGGSEADETIEDIIKSPELYYSFCCCRKP
ncbi:uncharacterized protein LOC116620796 [Nematostella vectensis]|uniref:uncharacterized protein LOC116620796 n=1 Tax=Nematostella vectensis TaxID=45351 RepID=UPI00207783D2|nr:uncharacterized protein LOC116620796 [Nematostella vectensis]